MQSEYRVLRVVSKMLMPFILVFALYVLFHGDYGPGGGFQAGVIFASGFILYGLVFGVDHAQRVVSPSILRWLTPAGVLVYAGVGVLTMVLGGSFLEYRVLRPDDPAAAQQAGILAIEIGVGVTVAAVMLAIFYAFAGRGRGKGRQ